MKYFMYCVLHQLSTLLSNTLSITVRCVISHRWRYSFCQFCYFPWFFLFCTNFFSDRSVYTLLNTLAYTRCRTFIKKVLKIINMTQRKQTFVKSWLFNTDYSEHFVKIWQCWAKHHNYPDRILKELSHVTLKFKLQLVTYAMGLASPEIL